MTEQINQCQRSASGELSAIVMTDRAPFRE